MGHIDDDVPFGDHDDEEQDSKGYLDPYWSQFSVYFELRGYQDDQGLDEDQEDLRRRYLTSNAACFGLPEPLSVVGLSKEIRGGS